MVFKPFKANEPTAMSGQRTLLYAHHGWGKTTQFVNYQLKYGPGFLISLESGLRSISSEAIDYLPVSSWDGEHDGSSVFSFKGVFKLCQSPGFKSAGYNWIGLDSLTEMSDRCLAHFEVKHQGNKNAFQLWGDYKSAMMNALKWLRDMDMHVLVTALAKEEVNDNGATDYWPAVAGSSVAKQVPGIFDNVLCGAKATEGTRAKPDIKRFVVADEYKGWHGKVRTPPGRRIAPVHETADITTVLDLI